VSGPRAQSNGSRPLVRPAEPGPGPSESERLACSVDEAAALLGIARETIYELIRSRELRSRKAGSRRIIGRHLCLSSSTAALCPTAGGVGNSFEQLMRGFSAVLDDGPERAASG
jgi:excisionase family DNA binding protein